MIIKTSVKDLLVWKLCFGFMSWRSCFVSPFAHSFSTVLELEEGSTPRQTEVYVTCSNWCLFSIGWTPAILAPSHPAGYKALIFICLLSLVLTFFFLTCSLNSENLGWVSLLLYTSQRIQYVKIPRQGLLRFGKIICSEWYNWKYWRVPILLNVSSHLKDAVLYFTPTGSHWRVLSWESEQQTLL